ncbi:tafazzin [Pyrgilauda ruficollis]|uniref:tafazzin n=1 Tax=Pyrgilauda ruficollis TaxID=221976 RepID=UPI001B874176|nr:tafazzin [Pyrgilauda ruficollis]
MPLAVQWPFPAEPSRRWALASRVVTGLVGTYSCVWTRECFGASRGGSGVPAPPPHISPPRTPTAADICFTRELHALFFSLGRCVPVCRGDWGLGMDWEWTGNGLGMDWGNWEWGGFWGLTDPVPPQHITVVVGRPFSARPLLERLRSEGTPTVELRKALTDFVQREFEALRGHARTLHPTP